MKKNKGITLIALIITIIILIILTAITLNNVIGRDLIGFAGSAAGNYIDAEKEEEEKISELMSKGEEAGKTGDTGNDDDTMFTFTVDDESYTCPKEYTWQQFIESEYSEDKFVARSFTGCGPDESYGDEFVSVQYSEFNDDYSGANVISKMLYTGSEDFSEDEYSSSYDYSSNGITKYLEAHKDAVARRLVSPSSKVNQATSYISIYTYVASY